MLLLPLFASSERGGCTELFTWVLNGLKEGRHHAGRNEEVGSTGAMGGSPSRARPGTLASNNMRVPVSPTTSAVLGSFKTQSRSMRSMKFWLAVLTTGAAASTKFGLAVLTTGVATECMHT